MASSPPLPLPLLLLLLPACFSLAFLHLHVRQVHAHPQHGFCMRTHMGPKGCPTPPTFDTINLTAYSGHWYQIGITARFQFVSEPGLVCGRVGYTLTGHKSPTSHPALLSVVNSGLTILRPAGVADIRNAGHASLDVCNVARSSCHAALHIDADIFDALQGQPATLKLVNDSVQAGVAALDSAAGRIGHIQEAINQVSQANYTGTLLNATAKVETNAGKLKSEDAAGLRMAGKALQDTGRGLEGDATLKAVGEKIRMAGKEMVRNAKKIEKGAVRLRKIGRSLGRGSGEEVTEGATVFKLEGQGAQVQGGKLQVNFFGRYEPYWVLAVEGDYEAALVYSCVNDSAGRIADKSMFIISRTWKLAPAVLDGFLSLAASYGFSTDCEDRFLLTVQRGGSCGLPPPPPQRR